MEELRKGKFKGKKWWEKRKGKIIKRENEESEDKTKKGETKKGKKNQGKET